MIANDLHIKINTAAILYGTLYGWEFCLSLEGAHVRAECMGEDVAMIDKKWLLKTHDNNPYNFLSFSTVSNARPDHSWSNLRVSVDVDGFRRRSPRNEILKSLATECLGTEQVFSKRSKARATFV